MGNQPSNPSFEESVMKKSPSSSSASAPHTPGNAAGVPVHPEAPPNYDDIFGAAPSSSLASSRPNGGGGGQHGPAAGRPLSTASFQMAPPSAAAWGTTATQQVHPQYNAPAPNWRQEEEEAELRMWFSAVDENNDGYITSEELRQALLNDNWTPFNMDTIQMMLKMFDRNMNDRIEFEEFSGLKRYVQEWKKVFDQYDVDHSGTIDVQEIQQAFRGMDYTFSLDFCTMMCRRFSLRSAGQINLDAFIYACAMVNAMSKDHAKLPNAGSLEDFLRAWLTKSA